MFTYLLFILVFLQLNMVVRFLSNVELLSPRHKTGLYTMMLSFSLLMLIMQIMRVWSFVCLSPTHTCRGMARHAQQRNSAGGRKRRQHCWATRTTGVPDVISCVENLTPPREIYASDGGLLVAPINAAHLLS